MGKIFRIDMEITAQAGSRSLLPTIADVESAIRETMFAKGAPIRERLGVGKGVRVSAHVSNIGEHHCEGWGYDENDGMLEDLDELRAKGYSMTEYYRALQREAELECERPPEHLLEDPSKCSICRGDINGLAPGERPGEGQGSKPSICQGSGAWAHITCIRNA